MAFPMNVAVASATRTPVGRALKGTLRYTRPEALAATCFIEALRRVEGLQPQDIDDVVLGCAMPEGEQGLNMARMAVLLSEWPEKIPAQTINRFCSSGLQAIAHGAQSIHAGLTQAVVAGGVESMSMVPMSGNKISLHPDMVTHHPEAYMSMGLTAECVAKTYHISRHMQDEFAFYSHQKALAALKAQRFKQEIAPVQARSFHNASLETVAFDTDECPRADTDLKLLSKLRPSFAAQGTVTAGNSSPLSDGAAAVVLVSDAWVHKLGIRPLGRLRAFTVVGVPPEVMGIGPVPAIRKLLGMTGLTLEDIDLFELNEAFAAQAAYCQQELGLPADRVNVNGGAIALGHPLGCTGAKLTATLLYELQRRQGRYGIVSMCIGGGMGAAGLYERS